MDQVNPSKYSPFLGMTKFLHLYAQVSMCESNEVQPITEVHFSSTTKKHLKISGKSVGFSRSFGPVLQSFAGGVGSNDVHMDLHTYLMLRYRVGWGQQCSLALAHVLDVTL